MATYPTGVYAPASKSAGQTIQASFFNDPEAEITALEDAVKNGFQHAVTINGALTVSTGGLTVSTGSVNIGGPSSLATLQVTGGSTLTGNVVLGGNLSVAGNSTVAGNLTVTGAITAASIDALNPRAKVTLSSAASTITHDTLTGLSWDVETYDSTGLHSTAANSSRLLLTSSGVWMVGAQIEWNLVLNPSTLVTRVQIVANDNEGVCGDARLVGAWGSGAATQQVHGVYYATSTSMYVTCRVYQNSGGGMVIVGSSGSGAGPTQFWVNKISG